MMPAGSVNAWKCDTCGGILVAVHVDEGTTPMFLACRASPGPGEKCPGVGRSAGYPRGPVPPMMLAAVAWEWRIATAGERKRWRREEPEMLAHVNAGGLVLDRLSGDGRVVLRQHHNYERKSDHVDD